MTNKIYDISLTPLDSTAAKVVSKGEHWKPKMKEDPNRACWDISPGTVHYTGSQDTDLTGIEFGRFKVVGLFKPKTKKKKAKWLVRCCCGMYETRYAKSIKNPDNSGDRCVKCRKLAQIKRHHEFVTTGRNTKDMLEF